MNPIFLWTGMWLALDAYRHGVTIVGAPGTGKSLLLKAFRMSVARLMREQRGLHIKLLDFDTKQDLYDIYNCFPDDCPIFELNPFVMGDIYDVMAEMEDPRDIMELAALMVDVSANEHQKFFPISARHILADVVTRHWLECRDVTTFADVVNSCASLQALRDVAESHPTTEHLTELLQANEVGMSIFATLAMEVKKFQIVAALYQTNATGRRVSSKTLVKVPRCVVKIPFDLKSVETLSPLARLLVSRSQQRILQLIEKDIFIPVILDELALLSGGIDLSIGSIFGRESGWCPVLSFQSYLSAFKTFGKEKLEATLSTAKTFICFHLPDRQDAEMAAKRFGGFEGSVSTRGWSESTSSSFSGGGSTSWSVSRNETYQKNIENVTADMIQALKVPAPGYPFIDFYMVTVGARPSFHSIRIADLVAAFFEEVRPVAPPRARSPKDMVLSPWKEADYERLKLRDDSKDEEDKSAR